jgi:hypothetical protein
MSNATPAIVLVTVHAFTREGNIALRGMQSDLWEIRKSIRKEEYVNEEDGDRDLRVTLEGITALESGMPTEVSQDWLDFWAFALAQSDRKDLSLRR